MRTDKLASLIWNTVVFIGCVLLSLVVVWPILFTLSSAVSPGRSAAALSPLPFANGFTFDNFAHLFTDTLYPRWFLNSFIVAVSTSIGTLLVASLAAYVFSRFTFTFKGSLLTSMIVLQIFPSFVGMIAVYVVLVRIGALDALWGLVLVYLAGNLPYSIWLVKSYLDTIPKGLDEAARIDGASHFRIFATIVMPVARPILIFLAVTTFAAPWMDFIFPKLVLRSTETQTLALGLISFVSEKNSDFTTFAAGAVIVAIPFMVFFLVTQRTLVTSLSTGAVKG
ncbi:sugar ABC transporter permease [Glycomyces albidus]|jgi:arabinogalactan oligomer/maltooligosaccharide transport system permease protein|uniref:ABC transporter permease subunit n=1 Tax=Glycomyces albidus TaxID=2656774 RepID=A0A6L5G8Q9_9ACTN|nr:ABC transporter permease subunit [Glycomyces albidus]MQM26037.1 ABC transporter permease subunit [Glycomyces albidus]